MTDMGNVFTEPDLALVDPLPILRGLITSQYWSTQLGREVYYAAQAFWDAPPIPFIGQVVDVYCVPMVITWISPYCRYGRYYFSMRARASILRDQLGNVFTEMDSSKVDPLPVCCVCGATIKGEVLPDCKGAPYCARCANASEESARTFRLDPPECCECGAKIPNLTYVDDKKWAELRSHTWFCNKCLKPRTGQEELGI